MSNGAGEVYFIAEEPSVGTPLVRVKIGLVRESQNRDSCDRRADHQTGNPRRLVLIEVVKTARVSMVENSLHQRYADSRGIGEWFELSQEDLDAAISTCQNLASLQKIHLPILQAADQMRHTNRNGSSIDAASDVIEWHRQHQIAKASESIFSALKRRYTDRIKEGHASGIDIADWAVVSVPRMPFGIWLKKNHPDAYEACKQPSHTISFVPEPLKIEPVLPPTDAELCQELGAKIAEWSPEKGFADIHQLFLETLRPKQIWEEEKELALAHLKVACGTNSAIRDVCEWKRAEKLAFSKDVAESQYPKIFDQFAEFGGFAGPKFRLRGGDESD